MPNMGEETKRLISESRERIQAEELSRPMIGARQKYKDQAVDIPRGRAGDDGGRRRFLGQAVRMGASLVAASRVAVGGIIADNSIVSRPESNTESTTQPLRWQTHDVATIPQGYQVAVADVNGDGRPDILALSSESSIVEWYENPNWKRHPITTSTKKNISLAPLAWRGSAFRGLALAADFHLEESTRGGTVWWAAPGRSSSAHWDLHQIARVPTSHRLRWADLDGDGQPELVDVPILGPGAKPPDYTGGAPITWFKPPDEILRGGGLQDSDTSWKPQLVDDSLSVVHGVLALDWDGDGRDELLTASFEGVHLFHYTGSAENLRWIKVHLAEGDQNWKPGGVPPSERHRGSSEIGVGKVAGRRFLATIEPWHGDQVAIYFSPPRNSPSQLWDRRVIDSSLRDGHALACADLDGDGNDEIVAGYRGPGTSLNVYRAVDASGLRWKRQVLDSGMAASGVVIADINGDGRPDVVAIGASTGNVRWYERLA
jgi:hypothetical protein